MDLGATFGAGVGFMPHGFCLLWRPELLWMLIISDAIIAAAYFSIPIALVYFVQRQKHIGFPAVFWMFGLFILACGTTHLIEIANIWTPLYWLSAYVKAFTALVSIATAVTLWPLLPKVSRYIDEHIQNRNDLADANQRLNESMQLLRRREGEMRQSERRYRLTVSSAPIGLATVSVDGQFLTVNATLCRMLGYSEVELKSLSFQEITHPDDLEADLEQVQGLLRGGSDSYRMNKRYFRRDGGVIMAQLDVALLRDEQGKPLHFVSQIQDISSRLRAETALRDSQHKLNTLLQNLPTAVLVHNGQGLVEYANPAAERLLGMGRRMLLGKGPDDAIWQFRREDGSVMPPAEHPVSRARTLGKPLEDCLLGIAASDGSATSWVQVSAFPDRPDGDLVERVIVTMMDVTDRKELEQKLKIEAQTDSLTGLLNRGHFMKLAQRELARARRHDSPLSLMMLDIDHFKSVNDRFGHLVGDQVLRNLGRICRSLLRENDLVCRLGGEEFALLFPETSVMQMELAGQRLRRMIEGDEIRTPSGATLRWTSSIGIASLSPQDSNIEHLIQRADRALYEAKARGRNRVTVAA